MKQPPCPHLTKAFQDLGVSPDATGEEKFMALMSRPPHSPDATTAAHVIGSIRWTKGDAESLAKMPAGWFKASTLPYTIRNAYWRCQRLETHGKLESRVVGEIPHLETEWKKKVIQPLTCHL